MFKKIFGKASQEEAPAKQPNPFVPEFLEVSNAEDLKSGDLVMARPFFQDPRFDRSVILLVGAGEGSLIGAVLTRATEDKVAGDFPILRGNAAVLHWGGPVNDSQLFCLHAGEKGEHSLEPREGVFFEPDMSSFLDKNPVNTLTADNSFFFKGLVQWGKEQFNGEILAGDWAFSRSEINLFDFDNSALWHSCFPGFETPLEVKIYPRLKANMGHEMYGGSEAADSMEIPEGQQPVSREITDDLMLFYVEDGEHSLTFLQPSFFQKHPAFTPEILERLAVRNLIYDVAQHIQIQGSLTDIVMVTAGGNFEAALVLAEAFMDQMHSQFGGDLCVGIPAQDLLFLTHARNDEGKEKIKGLIKKYFDNPETQGLLSRGLYLRKKGVNSLELLEHV